MMPLLCAARRPLAICIRIGRARSQLTAPLLRRSFPRSWPSRNSIAMNTSPSGDWPKSEMSMTFS
jgi:hypothetical protein